MNIYSMKKPKRINSVSISLVVIGLVVGYLGWAIIPVYWPIFQLSGIMNGTCNDAYREQDDDKLIKKLVENAQRTGLPLTKDNFRLTRIKYTEEEIQAIGPNQGAQKLMRMRGKECLLEMRYDASYALPLIDQKVRWPFERSVRKTLEQVKYDKTCTCVTVPRDET